MSQRLHLFERAIIKRGEHRGAWVVIERLIDATAWVELIGSVGGLLAFERDDLLSAWCPYCKQVIKPEQSITRLIDDESAIVQVHHLDCGIQDGDLLVSESGSSLAFLVMQRRDESWEPYGNWTLYDLAIQCEVQKLEKIESRPDEFSIYTGVYRSEKGRTQSEHAYGKETTPKAKH